MLTPPHPHLSYVASNASIPGVSVANVSGTDVTSSASTNTYGDWVQIHAGLTYYSELVIFRVAGTRTSADAIAASTLHGYADIGIGPNSGAVTVIAEKLSCSNSSGMGAVWCLPLRIPPDTPVWCRRQCTAASAKGRVFVAFHGGNMNPGTMPTCSRIVALGATTATTVGTTITPGASNAEGAWTQIVASTTDDYAGVMLSHLFNVDTTLTSELVGCGDVGVGGSGSEKVVGENITYSLIANANETRNSFHMPAFVGIPAGSRLCARWSGSLAADGTNSIIVYGLVH
jgi:hypothetical protein